MKYFKTLFIFIFLLLLFTAKASTALENCGPILPNPDPANINEFDDEFYTRLVTDILNEFELLPGTAIGIVKGDQLIYAQGFGFANLETCSPVTPETGFYLLSTTKSFTGMVGAILQEEGALQLEQTLEDFFPGLEMPVPLNPGQITIRQLLTHGKPFSNGGLNFRATIPGEMDKETVLFVLSNYSTPKPPTFEYSNTGYNLAGLIYEEATGKTWRNLIEEKIFQPLGMTSSTAYIEKALTRDFAQRYSINKEQGLFVVPNKLEAQMHPAGGTVSTVSDLSRWVITNLNDGRLEGEQVLPKSVVRQALAPQIQYNWQYYKFRRFAYGFGVHNADYEGDLLIHHFGGAIHVSFMPEHDLGVIILTNNVVAGGILSHRIAALTYDYLLGKDDFEARVKQERADAHNSVERVLGGWAERKQKVLERANPDDPTIDVAKITGSYSNDRLGVIQIYQEAGKPMMRYGVAIANLERLDGNSFTTLFDELDQGVPQVFDFRVEEENQVLDWDGRIFVKQ